MTRQRKTRRERENPEDRLPFQEPTEDESEPIEHRSARDSIEREELYDDSDEGDSDLRPLDFN